MSKKPAEREWVRDVLEKRGYKQRDLAKAWGASEAAVSRFLSGLDSGDLSLSRAYSLSRLLGMDLEELAQRMGAAGPHVVLPPPSVPAAGAPSIPTISIEPVEGRIRVLLHLDIPPSVAGELMTFVGKTSETLSPAPAPKPITTKR